ncbi:MAG: YdcF family protein [Lachnospiraceae bacterium]|nr:YdcF family protein [Lachnospiraceae bacterium]
MWMISGFAALGCLVYWILILFYSGTDTGFVWFWLGAAVCFGVFFAVSLFYRNKKSSHQTVPVWLRVSIHTLVYLGLVISVILLLLVYSGRWQRAVSQLDYIIVLGTYERSDYVNDVLRERLDLAVNYLQDNEDTMVIVAGGKTENKIVSEAKTMSDYLIVQGISSNRIIQEKQSSNTRQSLRYCERLIPGGSTVGIVTSEYHLYRAVRIAKAAGMEEVYGIGAPCSRLLELNYMVRECFVVFFDKWMGEI